MPSYASAVPTRKQRRRRAKDRRHEYEYVYVDDEGNELEVDADEVKAEQAASRNGRAKPNARAAAPQGRPAIQPPSWRRVGKRGTDLRPVDVPHGHVHQRRRATAAARSG